MPLESVSENVLGVSPRVTGQRCLNHSKLARRFEQEQVEGAGVTPSIGATEI